MRREANENMGACLIEGETNQDSEPVSGDARSEMIQAVKDATDAGAFPTILVTIAPRSDGELGSEVGVHFDRENDRDFIVNLLRRAVGVVVEEEVAPKVRHMSEEMLGQLQDWTRAMVNLLEAGKTPQAVIAVGADGESVEAVTGLGIEDVPAFLRDTAEALDEPEQTYLMDCTSQ